MKPGWRISVLATLAILIVAALLTWRNYLPVGDPAPAVSLQLIDGRKLSLQELRGKTVLLKFWASDCRVCIEEMPALANFYRQHQGDDFELIAVAMPYDPPDFVLKAVARQQMPYPVALDVMSEVVSSFGGIAVTPTAILISPTGLIEYRRQGPSNLQHLRDYLQQQQETLPAAG